MTRNVRQAAFSRDSGMAQPPTPVLPFLLSYSHRPLLRSRCKSRSSERDLVNGIWRRAPFAVRRVVVQRPAFWFLVRSKRVAGLSRRTNGAFRGCWPWYSLNCILVLLCLRGPTRRPRRKPLYREIVFTAATKFIISSPAVIRGRFASTVIINHHAAIINRFRFLSLSL